jgi:serine/threonine protein kinase/tetratricopeptide (TPR) repeat protein
MNAALSSAPSASEIDPRLGVLIDELTNRLHAGERVEIEDYVRRYPDLAERIRRLIPALEIVAELKHTAVRDEGPAVVPAPDPPPESGTLGDYRILREIGRGGMGVVYEAEQISLKRRVALKVLPFAAALDSRQLQRFKNEAHAAALLHHTNIVPVYAVGSERGAHYFAMQFIEGKTLADLIGELRQMDGGDRASPARKAATVSAVARRLTAGGPAEAEPTDGGGETTLTQLDRPESPRIDGSHRIGLGSPTADPPRPLPTAPKIPPSRSRAFFRNVVLMGIQAAEALEHAHSNGVLHRDIKPSNLLVDVGGNLWVTDFGLARLQQNTSLTVTGDILGTLRYMSPEQALAKRVPVDHRTDIYSLGVTLYETLTLRPAIDGNDRQEILRRLAQEEPRPPRKINPSLPADLETIVLKAMAKDPGSRYATAQELADDLRRFLEVKPIRARRPGLLERAAKWSRRHKTLVAAAAIVVLLSTVLLAISHVRVARERDQVRREGQRAEANFRGAWAAVDRYLTKVSHFKLLNVPGLQPLRKELLEMALEYYQEFIRQHENDPTLRSELADAFASVGLINKEISSNASALHAHEEALARRQQLVREYPTVFDYQLKLATSYDSLGNLLRETSRHGEAEQSFRQAIAILDELVRRQPESVPFRRDLARSFNNLGILRKARADYAEAAELYRQSIAIAEPLSRLDHSDVADFQQMLAEGYTNLGNISGSTANPDAAVRWFEQAIAILERLARQYPKVPEYSQNLGKAYGNLGMLQTLTGQLAEASQTYERLIAIQERLCREHSSVVEFQQDLAKSCIDWGAVLAALNKPAAAEQSYQRAIGIYDTLARDNPEVTNFRQELARGSSALGLLQVEMGQLAKAQQSCARAIAIHKALAQEHPDDIEIRRDLSISSMNVGRERKASGHPAEALKAWQDAGRLLETIPDPTQFDLYNLACAWGLASGIPAAASESTSSSATVGPPFEKSASSKDFASRAVDALRRAIAAGWSDAERVKTDHDLDALRSRKDFQALIHGLETPRQ